MNASFFAASMTRGHALWLTPTLVLALVTIPTITHATPSNMGAFSISSGSSSGKTIGRYKTANGGEGSFTIERNIVNGYTGTVGLQVGDNGIEVKNNAATASGQDKDKFKYTFTITPDNTNALHTIKIGQASYAAEGNSEIARHTLRYTANNNLSIPTRAFVKNNASVPYYYNAMGDYFMGGVVNSSSNQLLSEQAISAPQLRADSSIGGGSDLYYYNVPKLNGAGNNSPYTPDKNANNEVSLSVNNGVLPPKPTFANIFKASRDPNSYPTLSTNQKISNGGSYVSYGIANIDSNYVVAVQNAIKVELTYEGIMNGNIGIPRNDVVGETYNEWISFGVESEPYYKFTGTVFNDNGGISAADPNQTGAPYAGNTSFFNGKKEGNEVGIAGSTVSLTNCNGTIYDTTTTNANGNYQILVPSSQVSNTVCVTESANSASYPITTSPSSKSITINTGRINQDTVDFGRVVQDNAALVLEKFQFANQCNLPNLINDSDGTPYPYTKDAIGSTNPNVAPMRCIAYKLTATNRANLAINTIIISDKLAKKGDNAATVTATLFDNAKRTSRPAPAVGFADTLQDGENGTVKTSSFDLNAKATRSFYFNTRYGSTQSP